MIIIKNKSFIFKRNTIFFSKEPYLKNGLLSQYIQSSSTNIKLGFKRFPKFTKLINISNDEFINDFDKTNLRKIKRAKKEGVICENGYDIKEFVDYYNKFLDNKKLNYTLSVKQLEKYTDFFIIRKAFLQNGKILVFHSYLIDSSEKKVRAFHTASDIHNVILTKEEKSVIGRANRLLNFEDMIYFKRLGCLTYDNGGYAYNTKDISLQGINNFKDGFGGTLVEESNYIPYIVYIYKKVKKFIKKW